jgi:hypothetical protein
LVAPVEAVLSLLLFAYHSYKGTPLSPEGTAITFVIKKAFGIEVPETFVSDKPDMFRPDAFLGYTINSGTYNIIETAGAHKHAYRVTMSKDGVRSTSYSPVPAPRKIYILGNSIIWGSGLEDEMTAPWFLQERLPDYEVLNLAVTGYSTVQQLLQYRKLKESIQPDDIVIFSYSSADLPRNVADSRTIKTLADGYEMSLSNKDKFRTVRIPYASLSKDSALEIQYTPIVCDSDRQEPCARDTPNSSIAETVVQKIFLELIQDRRAHILVAFFDGDDNDPVVAYLRSRGIPVVDLRIKPGVDYDGYLPGEVGGHRGAFSSFRYYEGLLSALSGHKMLSPSVNIP